MFYSPCFFVFVFVFVVFVFCFLGVLLDRLKKGEEERRKNGEKEQLFPLTYKGKDVSTLNERLRFLRYYKGGFFAQHHDGCYVRPGNYFFYYYYYYYYYYYNFILFIKRVFYFIL